MIDYDDDISYGCECELDWSCGLHADRIPYIDRRYQGSDAEEARAYGVAEREGFE
jgi:hypothetical protein